MMLFKFSAQYFWHVIQVCMYVSKTQMHPCLKHRHVLRIYFGLHIFDLHHNYRDSKNNSNCDISDSMKQLQMNNVPC